MLWIISGAGLLVLLYLLRKVEGSAPSQPSRNAPLEEALPDYLASLAHRPLRRSPGRLFLRRTDRYTLDKSLRGLRSLSKEELLPAASVLNDHGRFLQEEIAALMRNLAHSSPIPAYSDGETRLGCFARELFAHTDAALTPEGLARAVEAWQRQAPFSVKELFLLPDALRQALLTLLAGLAEQCAAEQQTRQAALLTVAALKACREKRAQKLFRTYRHNKLYLSTLLNDIHKAPEGDAAIWSRQLPLLYELSAGQLADDECSRQSDTVRWVSHAIDSLQQIGHMPWNHLSEQWDRCHTLLEADPVYGRMDEESRAAYRQRADEIGWYGQRSAQAVCDAALKLAQGFAPEDVRSHVGYYLLDDGTEQLLAALRLEKSLSLQLRLGIRLSLPYRCLAAVPAPVLLFLFLWAGCHPAAALPVALLGGAAAAQGIRSVFARLTLPKIVPRLQLDSIPPEARTLVVCPVMLRDRQHALQMVRNLSVLQKANPDPQLHFLLLGDFRDSMAGSLISDSEIVETAAAAIEALQDEGTFFYLQRERVYHLPDHVHMGRERKRGALETVMKLITAQPHEDHFAYESIPADRLAGQYRYIITLDQHLLMPPGTALRMVGAMLHPLHKRCAAAQGMRGVSALQPAIQAALLREQTHLDRLLGALHIPEQRIAGQAAFDRNVLGIGAFEGSGIIDPKAFLSATQGQQIPGGLLNADLPDGLLSGCLRAESIVLRENRTESLQDRLSRLHRQTRSDWQLLPYLLDRLPKGLRPEKNTLLRKDRRYIRRTLLMSLLHPLQLLAVVLCIMLGEGGLLAAALLLPLLPQLPKGRRAPAGSLLYLLYLPPLALTRLDAIGRTLYRLFVSRQHLQDLLPAADATQKNGLQSMAAFYMSMATAGGISLLCLLPGSLRLPGLVIAGCFAAAPFVLPIAENTVHSPFRPTDYMREVLMRLARNTLLFFETAITPQDHSLPPDNVQIEPNKGISHHTTPANIGLYLCALIAAQILDLLTPDEAAQRIRAAVDTMEQLPKWNGHLYARYDTRTLQVQHPAFVSTAASGTLAVCLTTAAQGLRCILDRLHPHDRDLPQRLDALAEDMQFAPLYDPQAELFHTGMDTEKGVAAEAHCELLADEGRLASFYAVMTGQVPLRHWHRLGRNRVRTGRGQTLLSGTGSLSEYLVPFLFQPPIPGSLLTEAAKNAVLLQASDKQQGVWGISESGYYAFDPQLHYLSKAFGLADLALEPDAEADVIAPYAGVLSLCLAPKAAFHDLLKLQSLGLEGPLGMFEAADMNPSRIGNGHPFRLVHSHTARHQGMILCAICNFLCNQQLANLFYQLPGVQAYRLLLEEPMHSLAGVVRDPLRQIHISSAAPSMFATFRAHSLQFPINAHMLRGAGTTLVVNATGGGFLRKSGMQLTCFEECCHIPSGIRLYLRDSQSGAYWQATDPGAEAMFETAQAVFSLRRNDVESSLRIFVDPLSGAAVHALTVQNRSEGQRMLEVCSYMEPALLPQTGPQQDTPEESLWLHCEKLGTYGVSVCRRQAGSGEPPVLWHLLTADTPMNVFHIQTSRLSFIGRGRTVYAPRELEMPLSGLADTLGDIPEPCASLRGQFVLPKGGSARFVFVTHMPKPAESASAFLLHCGHPDSVLDRYDAALTQALVTAQTFGLTPEVQSLFAPVCGLLCYSGQPGQNRWADGNALSHAALRELSIDGVAPIAVWECSAREGLESAELLLRMHAHCHIAGFRFDLVFLPADDAPTSLYRSLREQILHSPGRELLGQSGGIHLFEPGKPTPELRALLFAAARLAMKDNEGNLQQQLAAMQRPAQSRPVYQQKSPVAWRLSLPALPELLLANGYGGFTPEEGNYVITLPPGRQTPAPWCNPLGNNRFGTLAGESGLLFITAENQMPLTRRPRDTVTPCGSENFFLRDENHRLLWSLTRQPLGCHLAVRVTHAPGETVYESSGYGIYSRMHCFTDLNDPLGLRVIHLRNEDTTERILTFCHSLMPEGSAHGQPYRVARAGNGFLMDAPGLEGIYGSCLIDQDASILSVMSAGTFHGLWGVAPAALSSGEMPAAEEGNVALLCTTVQLKPGESRTLVCAVGYGEKRSALNGMFRQLQNDGATRRLHRVKQYWEHRLSSLQFDLPDQGLCLLLNRWLPYQIRAVRQWLPARLYPYKPESGIRDCLERIPALQHTEPGYVRESLIYCTCSKARKNPRESAGRIPDLLGDLLLLPWMTALYVQETDDRSILEELLPFPHCSPDRPDAQENTAASESDRETLQAFCLKLLLQMPEGAHGLPETGSSPRFFPGESVWLGMFLCESLRRFAPLCSPAEAEQLLEKRLRLLQLIDRCGWDGSWYLGGWHADGTPAGSREAQEGSISLLPQVWAVVCGASRDRCQSAMENVWRLLYQKSAGLLRLFTPPFSDGEAPHGEYPPGVGGNGGQITRTAGLTISALHQLGQEDRAWELALCTLPTHHTATRQMALRYRSEPYAMPGWVCDHPRQRGMASQSWEVGGAASVMAAITDQLLGFSKCGNRLRFRPVLPTSWDEVRLSYRYGNTTYHLHASRACTAAVCDGQPLTDGTLALNDDGRIHEAVFPAR